MKITYRRLINAGACDDALEEFKRIFGESAEVTPENVALIRKKRALNLYLNATWIINVLLSKKQRRIIQEEYQDADEKYMMSNWGNNRSVYAFERTCWELILKVADK